MIFVTVGTQLGFDRLVRAVDLWAADNPGTELFVQIGRGSYRPRYCPSEEFTDPQRWDALFQQAEEVVSHAGMGTILKSLDHSKPLIVMPRLASLGEHRNDHQCATARRFRETPGIRVVNDARELHEALSVPARQGPGNLARNPNLDALLHAIRLFTAQS